MQRSAYGAGGALLLSVVCGCGPIELGTPAHAIYVVPESLDELSGTSFLDHPFPSDLRIEDGSVRFEGFYNPRQIKIIAEYLDASQGLLDGFSPVAAGYLRFDGPLDPTSLPPTPTASLHPRSSVQLIDVDPESPEYGARKLVTLSYRAAEGVYLLPSTLRFMPTLGFPLRPGTRYALVATRALQTIDGGDVLPSAELGQVLGIAPADGPRVALKKDFAPSIDALSRLGIRPSDIAHLAVFTTNDPSAELRAVHEHLRTEVAPPTMQWRGGTKHYKFVNNYVEYQSVYGPSPNYQVGVPPFDKYGDGGEFNFVDGEPEVYEYFDARFSLTVPANDCVMPEAGWPVVLYAHGTGGSWRSYIKSGYVELLADRCIAMMGVDQIFHGTRPGAPDEKQGVQIAFFNFENLIAARTNGRQSALDEVQRARLFTESPLLPESSGGIPSNASHTGEHILFDPSKVMFFGHSQGGLNGPLYLAIDDSALGGVLSGSGAVIIVTLLEKTEPSPSIADLLRSVFLGLKADEYDELDFFHPALSLAQSMVDTIDPINYARMIALEPRPGFMPKSVYMSEGIGADGIGDSYTPPHGTEAQAIAMGLPLQLPAQVEIDELAFGGPEPIAIPVEGLTGNLPCGLASEACGLASGVLAQWAPPAGTDGHFVVFNVPEAEQQISEFLAELADDPTGRIPAP